MSRSIRWRLVGSYVLLTVFTVSLIGVLTLSLVKRYVAQQEQDYLTANAEAVARQALPFMWPALLRYELRELASTSSALGNARVRILDSRRQVLADSGPRTEPQEFVWVVPHAEMDAGSPDASFVMMLHPSGAMVVPVQRDGQLVYEQLPANTAYAVVRRVETIWGSRLVFEMQQSQAADASSGVPKSAETVQLRSQRVVSVPIGEAGSSLGYVELSGGPDFGSEALATTRRAFLLAGGGAALMAVVVGLLVGQGLTAPLRNLTAAASRMSGGDLSARALSHGRDEIGQLASQFNHMAARLETSFAELSAERDALRRFIADASHELRTPITALKTFNELLQDAASDDPSARAEFLAESQAQLGRLEWLTHNLLDLSRLDAGLVDLYMADHDVGELMEAAVGAFRALAVEKGVRLWVRPPAAPLQLRCDRGRIELALSNLIDNALKFTPAGGEVQVGAGQAGQVLRMWVEDAGGGIDPSDLPHIFERFYRGQNGRSVTGSGLGLAIVQSIVQAHAGRVFVESTPEGSRFVIEFDLPGSSEWPGWLESEI